MPIDPELRSLDIDLPACPRALVELSLLLANDTVQVSKLAELIETDMALASAVVRTVNSAMFGLLRRVETVGEAVRYLGTREVAAITFEIGLRSAFPPTPQLDALWDHAAQLGLLMGRSATPLGLDPMRAHTAGLFAASGQAVLLARSSGRYAGMLDLSRTDPASLAPAEIEAFGVTHQALGAALCRAWGLASEVAEFVREHGRAPSEWASQPEVVRELLVLGSVCEAQIAGDDIAERAGELSFWVQLQTEDIVDAVQRPWERMTTQH